jgi:AcrR family transcriptional regulator
VLDAALMSFTENTFGGTSMAQVAERAGVAVGSIYRHFPSKEALGNAVHLRWKTELLDRIREAVDPGASVRVAFGQLWQALARFVAEHHDAFAFLEYQKHDLYVEDDSRGVTNEITGFAFELIRQGQRAGEIRSGAPEVLLSLVYGAFVGLTRVLPASGEAPDAERTMAEAEAAVWDLLRAPS